MRDWSRAWSRFYRQSEQVMWSGIPSGSPHGVNPSPEKPLTAFDRSRIPASSHGVGVSFLAFRGVVGDGHIRRSVPRSGRFLPPLHLLFCRYSPSYMHKAHWFACAPSWRNLDRPQVYLRDGLSVLSVTVVDLPLFRRTDASGVTHVSAIWKTAGSDRDMNHSPLNVRRLNLDFEFTCAGAITARGVCPALFSPTPLSDDPFHDEIPEGV